MRFIGEKASGRQSLGAGTLYGASNTLGAKGRIEALGNRSGGRKKEYIITGIGREAASRELERLRELTATAGGR